MIVSNIRAMTMTHLALDPSGIVLAQFMHAADCAEFCRTHSALHVPFNLNNRDGAAAPLVGTRYEAA